MGILTEDMKRVIRRQKIGYVATVCADGTPNLSLKATTLALDLPGHGQGEGRAGLAADQPGR